jgi:hypothetical protein
MATVVCSVTRRAKTVSWPTPVKTWTKVSPSSPLVGVFETVNVLPPLPPLSVSMSTPVLS